MKPKILAVFLFLSICFGANSQNQSITLKFTAENNVEHVALNSILIENLTRGGEMQLNYPDTVVTFDFNVGISENTIHSESVFKLSQNEPNPFESTTRFSIDLLADELIHVQISDITGKILVSSEYSLSRGLHNFEFSSESANIYFLTVRNNVCSKTIKMFDAGICNRASPKWRLDYNSGKQGSEMNKNTLHSKSFEFLPGDILQYTGTSAIGNRTFYDTPLSDNTYTFVYGNVTPCPGMPTVTDIDGNIYNTVLVGNQCWMHENLKTTTYNNGTAIPNVTSNGEWTSLTSGAFVWYDNNESWKNIYGGLYNWFATTDDDGLCPEGWHVPTYDDWMELIFFMGGMESPYGNELKSCRQENSPLGGSCNTSNHPRWKEDTYSGNYGTDTYGFSTLPAGVRNYYGSFFSMGDLSLYWSQNEGEYDGGIGVRLHFYEGLIEMPETDKQNGQSVRCIKDQ